MSDKLYNINDRMDKTIHSLKEELTRVRAGRANPSVLDRITIEYYGTPTLISQVGNISVSDARTLVIQPWDVSVLREIEKAISKADIGLNPNNDGKVIRLNFPALTEERRISLKREVEKIGEDSKVAIRGVRRDVIEKAKSEKKEGILTEDDLKVLENDIQKVTDKYIEKINEIIKEKSDELMEI